MGDFRKLKVWQAADDLVVAIYQHTKNFPMDERFGLRSQIRRAVVSIPSNIAEGAGRNSNAEFRRFAVISLGSANEVAYQIHVSGRLGYLQEKSVADLASSTESVKRMLAALVRSLGPK